MDEGVYLIRSVGGFLKGQRFDAADWQVIDGRLYLKLVRRTLMRNGERAWLVLV